MIVIIDDRASLKLFTASNIIAIDDDSSPIPALNPDSKILVMIPIILVFIIYLV